MNIPIGWVIAVASCIYGFLALGGKLGQLWVPSEYLIIFGAATGALVAGNKGRNLKNIVIAIGKVFVPASVNKKANTELLSLMFELLQRIQRDGRLSIDSDVENPDGSAIFAKYPAVLKNKRLKVFLRDYLRMIVSGNNNPSHIDTVMSQEIEVLDKEAREPSNSLLAIADSLPAFGIVAAITGVIHTLSELQDVTEASDIGIGMAAALVGTLLGVFMSYAVVGPVASTLKQLADAELRPFESVREIVVAYYSGFAPLVAVEYGRKVLFSDQRPTMDELENSVMATSGQPFRDR